MTPSPGRPAHRALLDRLGTSVFEDVALYDATYRRRRHDVAWYVGRAAGVPRLLELGCGSGRVTLPLARAGVRVTAVDRSEAMLDALTSRLARERREVAARVHPLRADLRALDPSERFPLVICPFNTFLHLYDRDDVARALAAVGRALAPGGRFVFDTSLPRPGDLRDRRARGRSVTLGGRRHRYEEEHRYEPLEQILYVASTWTPVDGGEPVHRLLAHRQFFPAELEALLHLHGLRVVSATAWGAPLDRDPDAIVWECAASGASEPGEVSGSRGSP